MLTKYCSGVNSRRKWLRYMLGVSVFVLIYVCGQSKRWNFFRFSEVRRVLFGHTYKGETNMQLLHDRDPEFFDQIQQQQQQQPYREGAAIQTIGSSSTFSIPKVIVLTWKSAKDVPQDIIKQWKDLNPDYALEFYDDNRIVDFLRENYGEIHVNFFNNMVFGRFKADFFRYCYLYKRGGVYADIDLDPYVPISSWLDKDAGFFTVLSGIYGLNGTGRAPNRCVIFQAYIASSPYHPILREAIEKMMTIGPRIGVDPPETTPFSEYHPTRCLCRIIERILGQSPSGGRWETPYGPILFAEELKLRPLSVAFNGLSIAKSRRAGYKQEVGF